MKEQEKLHAQQLELVSIHILPEGRMKVQSVIEEVENNEFQSTSFPKEG